MSFPTGQKDVDREILSKLPDEDVIKACSANSYLKEKVCDEGFFKRRLEINYPELKFVINKQFLESAGLIYPTYKQAYLETVYYISKMEEIDYEYVRNGHLPKGQYRQAKEIYDEMSRMKMSKKLLNYAMFFLRDVIDAENLNLIKYTMSLYKFPTDLVKMALANSSATINIIKYFADRGEANPLSLRMALEDAHEKGDIEMIRYFESKLQQI